MTPLRFGGLWCTVSDSCTENKVRATGLGWCEKTFSNTTTGLTGLEAYGTDTYRAQGTEPEMSQACLAGRRYSLKKCN